MFVMFNRPNNQSPIYVAASKVFSVSSAATDEGRTLIYFSPKEYIVVDCPLIETVTRLTSAGG